MRSDSEWNFKGKQVCLTKSKKKIMGSHGYYLRDVHFCHISHLNKATYIAFH